VAVKVNTNTTQQNSNKKQKTGAIAPNKKQSQTKNKFSTIRPEASPDKELRQVWECLTIICKNFGCSGYKVAEQEEKGWRDQVGAWKVLMGGESWNKFIKYKLAAYFAYHMRADEDPLVLPAKPLQMHALDKPHILLGGAFGRWMRVFLKQRPMDGTDDQIRIRSEFLNSILNSKKGMPRAKKEELSDAESALIETLTKPQVADPQARFIKEWGSWPDNRNNQGPEKQVSGVLSRPEAERQIRRTVKELFSGVNYTLADRLHPIFPSTSSNYINSRSGGGVIGTLFDNGDLAGLRRPGGYDSLIREETRSIKKKREEEREEEVEIGSYDEDKMFLYESDGLKKTWGTLWFRILKKAAAEKPVVKPVALAEPLKIRVITKGPPYTYTVLKALQKKMHSTLKRIKQFQLLGQPDDADILVDCLGARLPEGKTYISADYKGATDNLKSWASECAVEEISDCLKLSNVERGLFKASLTGHFFEDPKTGNLSKQTKGQLMGSIVSFPILCVLNAAVCRWAMELAEDRTIPIRDTNMAINGDDVVMKSDSKAYNYWKVVAGFIGLEESIGKTYVSKRFFNINSRTYILLENKQTRIRRNGSVGVQPFLKTKFLNMGLLFGMKRSSERQGMCLSDQLSETYNLSSIGRAIVRETPGHLLESFYRIFINRNREYLESFRLPWFMPEWLGGLGLPKILKNQSNSDLDLRIAGRIVLNWNKEKPKQLSRGDSPWKVREIVERNLPQSLKDSVGVFARNDAPEVKDYQKLLAVRAINLLFDSNVGIDDLYKDDKADALKAINHNRDLWSPKRGLGPKLANSVVDYRGRYEGITLLDVEKSGPIAPLTVQDRAVLALVSPSERVPSTKELQNAAEAMLSLSKSSSSLD
jgi:hypothetical protein